MAERELVVHSVQMIEVDGSWNIPTAILYRSDGPPVVGNAALAAGEDWNLVNEDFKIDLGRYAPNSQSRRRFQTATGALKSAADLADDFLLEIQRIVKKWLNERGVAECKHVVIAEPLSLHGDDVSKEWLENYRTTVRRLIEGKRIMASSGVTVSFIPEPFAAYQYYRHGNRHPIVAQSTQLNALVIDFGGGTCDVCIIQTTKLGEISGSGRNARPLAGKSLAVGGFTLNRELAESLLVTAFPDLKSQIRTGMQEYRQWLEGKRPIETFDTKYKAFVENFHAVVHRCEALKLSLCRSVSDWTLTADLRFSAPIVLPADPFDHNGKHITAVFTAGQLRELFVKRVYQPLLKPFMAERLKFGAGVLEGAPISVVLLSGGSANIGWLRTLLEDDFKAELEGARFVKIPDFQQVVAQGLAVECAREFASGSGDFKAVTYNQLFLLLEPDGSGCEPKAFVSRTAGLPDVKNRPGLLLPAASLMSSFVESPMQWRVRLNRAARRKLDYHFLQSSMDPNDLQNRHNIEEQTVYTPANSEFDPLLTVELTLRSDGTAIPKFIYRTATPSASEISKEGRKFFIDMTDPGGSQGEAYVGIDFGSSNTAISYIDRSWIEALEIRGRDSNWKELGELVELLPAPLATPLAKYIGDVHENSPVPPGFSFIEAALCMIAYTAYIEFCCSPRRGKTRLFKGFVHRSASHLWHLVKELGTQFPSEEGICSPVKRLLEPKNRALVDRVVRAWANTRHELSTVDRNDLLGAVRLIANISQQIFSSSFGFFEGVQKERFSPKHIGRFRVAHGKPPFSEFDLYRGEYSWSESEAVLIDRAKGSVLNLTPLIFWYPCKSHPDSGNGHCFFFDKMRGIGADAVATFKSANTSCLIEAVTADKDLGGLVSQILNFQENDPQLSYPTGMTLGEKVMRMG